MANILFSRAGGLLSLEGRSLLFSSHKASSAYAKGKDVEMAWRVPVFLPRILWSEGPSVSPSDPLAVSLPHLQRFCLCGNTPWPGKVWPVFPEGHILVFPLQAPANGGLFSFRSNYALEGRSSLFSLPEGKWSLSWRPSQHTPNPVLTFAHVGTITRTLILPSCPEWYAELSLGELPLLKWETRGVGC